MPALRHSRRACHRREQKCHREAMQTEIRQHLLLTRTKAHGEPFQSLKSISQACLVFCSKFFDFPIVSVQRIVPSRALGLPR